MNNVKLARKFLWVLILTTVCSRGFAMQPEDARHLEFSVSGEAANVVSTVVEQAATEAVQGLEAKGVKAFCSRKWTSAKDFLAELPKYLTVEKATEAIQTVKDIPANHPVATDRTVAVVTVLGVDYLVFEGCKYVMNCKNKHIVSVKTWIEGHATIAKILESKYTEYTGKAILGAVLYRYMPGITNKYFAGITIGVAVAHALGLDAKLVNVANNNRKTTAGVAAAAGTLALAQYKGYDVKGWSATALVPLYSMCNWVKGQYNQRPWTTGLTAAGVALPTCYALYNHFFSGSISRAAGAVTSLVTRSKVSAELKKQAIAKVTADVNGVTQYMGVKHVPTAFAQFALTNPVFAGIAAEFKTRLEALQNQSKKAIDAQRAQVIADFSLQKKFNALQLA